MELRTVIDWKRIIESMPRAENYADDRIPTIEEIRKLVEHHDPRIKSIVYTMCSCGMRVGSWEFLKLKHITPITKAEHLQWKRQKEIDENPDHASKIVIIPADDETKIVACKVILHGEKKRKRRNNDYVSFISPEAWHAIQKWLEFRKRYGEQIRGESYIMRHLFPVAHKKRADDSVAAAVTSAASTVNDNDNDDIKITVAPRGRGLDRDAAHPTKMPRDSISSLLSDALYEQGLRETLEQGKTRHEFKSAHFTRKFFKTRAQQYMNSLNVEKLMDHRIGLDPNYWRPIEPELLADYLKAVPALTINDTDVTSLKEQQEQLEHRYQDKEKEIEDIRTQQTILQANMTNVLKFLARMEKEVKIQAWDVSDGPFQTATKIIEEKREKERETTTK
jgi:integrase